MKKYLIALSTLLFSLSSNAAFVTLPDGVTPSTVLEGQAYVGDAQIYAIDLEVPPVEPPTPGVPAPASLGILALGMLGLVGGRKLRK